MQLESYILNSKEDLYRAFEYANSLPINYFVLDLETDGVLEKTANIYGVGFCFSAAEAFYIPVRAKDGTELWDTSTLSDIKSFIQQNSKKHKLLGHNIIYDTLVLIHHWDLDIVMDVYADTILMKHCLDENPPFGLKEIGEQYFGPEAVKAQEALYDNIEANGGKTTKENLQMFKADTEVLGTYCAWDVSLTARLFELFTPRLKEEGLEDLFYKDEIMPLYREVVIPMKRKGFPVDVEHFRKLKHDIELDLVRLENTIYENIKEDIVDFELELLEKAVKITYRSAIGKALIEKGLITKEQLETQGGDGFVKKLSSKLYSSLALDITNPIELLVTIKELHLTKVQEKTLFNINSTQHLAWLFYTHFKLPVEERTEKGAPKLSAAVLEEMSVDHPIAKQIIEYKKLQKLVSTYVEGILDRQHDGVLYASFLLFGTTSGRFSSRNINLQNLPRVKEDDSGLSPLVLKYVNAIKEGLIAGKGNKLINSDYCLHPKTELLTKRGWIPVLEVSSNDEVWQVEKTSLLGSWTKPSRLVKREYFGDMYTFGNRRGSLTVTKNHRMLWVGQEHKTRLDKKNYRLESLSQDLIPNTGCNFAPASINNKVSFFSEKEIWLACMTQADGSHVKNNKYRIQVSIDRKRKKVAELLGRSGKLNSIRQGHTLPVEEWTYEFESSLLDIKNLVLDNLGYNQIEIFLEALAFWDGSMRHTTKKAFVWGTTNKQLAEKVQAFLVTNECEARLSVRYFSNENHKTFYMLSVKKGSRVRLRKQDVIVESNYSGMVGCVTVDTGFILVRSEGRTFVTGNCQLEPCAFACASGDKKLQQVFIKGHDLYSSIAVEAFGLSQYSADKKAANYLKNHEPEARQKAKVIALACVYGAEAGRISQLLNCSREEAQSIIDAYMNAYPELRTYMADCDKQVKTLGYVKTKFGRIRHLPKAKEIYNKFGDKILDWRWAKQHGLTELRGAYKNELNNAKNFPIQGIAAHIVNRAMLQAARNFKRAGLDATIIATVHDEICCIAPETQAAAVKRELQDAMENTVVLEVPLSAEPLIGDNWAEAK